MYLPLYKVADTPFHIQGDDSVNKASGPDQLPNYYLRETAKQTAPILAASFSQSLKTGVLPSDWLTANVSPIFKKGDRHTASNYRPVSLTCVCYKVLEHIIVKHMLNHLDSHNILTDKQHGFRSGHSCESQLIITIHDLLTSVDGGRCVDLAILDFSKAFDTVPHHRLMSKLGHYGIKGDIHNWISGFLMGRSQKVVVDGFCSPEISVDSGVPQGSVLGPILFLIFINDLPQQVKSHCCLFADDCLLYREISCLQDSIALQQDLTGWSDTWGLHFNAKKCYIMSTAKGKDPYFHQLNGHVLSSVKTSPYLGVLLSEDLSFSPHIGKVSQKASSNLGFISRNLKGCPERLKELAYITLVRPRLEYASSVWDPHTRLDIDKLEKIQCRAARFVKSYSRYRRADTDNITSRDLINILKWDSLASRRKMSRLCMLYKAVNGEVALPTHILQTADHKYKHLPAKKSALAKSEGLEHFESGSEVSTFTCSIQSQTAAIFILAALHLTTIILISSMLCVHSHYKYFNSFSAILMRQNLKYKGGPRAERINIDNRMSEIF